MIRLPIRARLTVTFAALMAAVLVGLGLFLYLRLRTGLDEAINEGLSSRADSITATTYAVGVLSDPVQYLRSDEVFAQVLDTGGRVIDASPALEGIPLLTPRQLGAISRPTYLDRTVESAEERIPARILVLPQSNGLVIVVGDSLEQRQQSLRELSILLWIGGPIALAITSAIVWLLAGFALRPVEKMRSEAAAISDRDLDRRLPVTATGDEIERLGSTLNGLLDRIQRARERERRFVDDASHELRTPLAVLRTEIDLALRRARTVEELEGALRSAGEESERLNNLANDLLVLARSDRRQLPVRRRVIDLGELVDEVARSFESVASDKNVVLRSSVNGGPSAAFDPDRLRQALGNLFENAIRHSPAGGVVTVASERSVEKTTLTVRDSGDGFPEDFLSHAFEPFARTDFGRGRQYGGTGLGLAIVRAIVEAHGGTASASNDPRGGAVVALSFPDPGATSKNPAP